MKRYNILLLFPVVIIAFQMSGCAPIEDTINPYNENFNCKAKSDEGECVDTMAAYEKARHPEKTEPNGVLKPDTQKTTIQDSRYQILSELLTETKKPILQPPKILRVLMLPYKGENQELFMTRYVYLKIENGDWILTDLSEK